MTFKVYKRYNGNFYIKLDVKFYTFATFKRMKIINKISYIISGAFLILLSSCNEDMSEIPTFLTLKAPIIEHQAGLGSTSHNVEDYWLYVGNELIGVFSQNQAAPVIGEGIKDLSIQPGIRVNGLRDEAYIYPFLETYRSQVDLCACGEAIDVQPTFKYKPTAKFSFIEDFESGNIFGTDLDENPSTTSIAQNDTVFEGSYSLLLNVNAEHTLNQTTSLEFYNDFASDGRDVFVEFNYKSNVNFLVGLEADINGVHAVELPFGIFKSDHWKKMYISLTDLVAASKADDGYRVVFQLQYPTGSTLPIGQLYLDNIKLVHY